MAGARSLLGSFYIQGTLLLAARYDLREGQAEMPTHRKTGRRKEKKRAPCFAEPLADTDGSGREAGIRKGGKNHHNLRKKTREGGQRDVILFEWVTTKALTVEGYRRASD